MNIDRYAEMDDLSPDHEMFPGQEDGDMNMNNPLSTDMGYDGGDSNDPNADKTGNPENFGETDPLMTDTGYNGDTALDDYAMDKGGEQGEADVTEIDSPLETDASYDGYDALGEDTDIMGDDELDKMEADKDEDDVDNEFPDITTEEMSPSEQLYNELHDEADRKFEQIMARQHRTR